MRSPSLSSSKQTEVGGRGGGGGGCSGKKAAEAMPRCSKMGLKRGPWTAEEDQLLAEYIKREGEGRWRTLPNKAGLLRCGKSCRLRWMNYLRPSIKRGHISPDEEDLILRLHRLLGNRWSLIAGRIPGRTDNEIKNYWNTHLSKKLISQGIDPKTHKPLTISSNPNPSINSHNYNNLETNIPSAAAAEVKEDSTSGVHEHHSGKDDQLQKNCIDDIDQGMIIVSDVENGDEEKEEDDDDETRKTYADDAFSSFLNSLINDDMFNINQQNEQDDQENEQSSG